MIKGLVAAAAMLALGGCASFGPQTLPRTMGEQSSGYGYVPLDGLAVAMGDGPNCKPSERRATPEEWLPLLKSLPDLSVRFSVADFEPSGSLTFGPAKVTASGQAYRAVLDYVNVDAIPETFYVRRFVKHLGGELVTTNLHTPLSPGDTIVAYEARLVPSGFGTYDPTGWAATNIVHVEKWDEAPKVLSQEGWELVTVPIYVGIGMRLAADVRALKGGITLSSLGSIGAEAEAKNLTGTLTVQTLGINGKSIATTLPLPSKLDQTTIENGILALGSSRAIIYNVADKESDVTATPRVVGLYSPIGTDPLLINALYSELSKDPPIWRRPCRLADPKPAAPPPPSPAPPAAAAAPTAPTATEKH